MPLIVELDHRPVPLRETPPPFSPPSLEQLDSILAERRVFLDQRGGRPALVQLLLEEHRTQGAPEASLRNIERLAQGDCFAVVTGQQPGLLTGPLYTPWKILSTLLLAGRLDRQRSESFVPVFWNAGEDHDTAEMDHFDWLDRGGQPIRFGLDLPPDTQPVSFGSRPLRQLNLERLFAFWDEILFDTDFSPRLKDLIGEASRRAETMGEFLNQLLWRLFPDSGLVILSSFYRNYPQLVTDLLERELEDPLRSNTLVNEAGEQLRAKRLKPKMHRAPERCSFFLYEEDARLPLEFSQEMFVGPQATYPAAALRARLQQCPGDFSAAANLRPVLQDALLPTAVNVLGPGEFAYQLQLQSLYAHHRVPQPAAAGRLQLTLLPPRISRGLARLGLEPAELQQSAGVPVPRLSRRSAPPAFEALCEQLKAQIRDTLSGLLRESRALDKSLEPSIIGHEKQLLAQVEKLQNRLAAKVRRQDGQTQQILDRLQAALRPNGQAQERVLNLFYFLNLFGEEFLPALAQQLKDADLEGDYFVRIQHGE